MGVISRALARLKTLRRGPLERARHAEALGQLEEATALYVSADASREAARLYALRADAALAPEARLELLAQAIALSPPEAHKPLLKRRGALLLSLVKSGESRQGAAELVALGESLERAGEPGLAAEAFALAGDLDAQTRALVAAGAVEKLEAVLDREQAAVRETRRREQLLAQLADLNAAGRRRDALAAAAAAQEADERVRELAQEIQRRRVASRLVELELDAEKLSVAFGEEVSVGRSDSVIVVPSPSVSRQHLLLRHALRGPEVVDLGSRNGTSVGGARLDVPLPVGEGLELLLGGEVKMSLSRWGATGVRLEVLGRVFHAPLGPLDSALGLVAPAHDDWLLLTTRGAVKLGPLGVDGVIELCHGDCVSSASASLRVLG